MNKPSVSSKITVLRDMVTNTEEDLVSNTISSLSYFLSSNKNFYYNETYILDALPHYKDFILSFKKKEEILRGIIATIQKSKSLHDLILDIQALTIEIDNLWVIRIKSDYDIDTKVLILSDLTLEILEEGNIARVANKDMYYKFIVLDNCRKEETYYHECDISKKSVDPVDMIICAYIEDFLKQLTTKYARRA